jgi:hypothetical protein
VKGAGGTSGGVGTFFAGTAMVLAGGYLLLTRVSVTSGGFLFYGGYNAFGLSLVPLLVGIGMLFYNGRSVLAWLLTAGGALIILAGIVSNLHLHFRPTSLFDTLMMLGLLAGGLGLVVRSLQEVPADEPDSKAASGQQDRITRG